MWDPNQYLAFADHRGRPFYELTSRIGATAPRRVADLGCGPGNLTVSLAQRWPEATIEAVDSSPEMVDAARLLGLDARVLDLRDWTPEPDTDVLVSNAALQWIPEHRKLMQSWAGLLPSKSWIAIQVPGNFDAPSHAAVRELASTERWIPHLADIPFRVGKVVDTPTEYADLLSAAGCSVDAWETTYIQQLDGEHPVLEWIKGTALVPVKAALSEEDWNRFRDELVPLLDQEYPKRPDGSTFYEFRRIFVVAQVR
ncbi:trans-aconitate 2-methyltransferase [Antrihabitans spumae]|uniref:Trans-aconitate 2-methyltransferase n=1 Tax=Antrihabitans spumae TaxID=3373370 RepID=A0ABW7JVS5_9NOCA